MNEREIFLAAIEISDPAERAAYVEQTCAEDAELRVRVEELLRAREQDSQFLETPAAASASAIEQTLLTDVPDADDDPAANRAAGEAQLSRYLTPSTRDGWLGRLAHYEVEEILGQGAFGIVVKAFDEKLHRVVAIKLMSPELASTSPPRKRFLREARTAAAVTHENIVAIHAVEEEPIPYLVMEYIPGLTLQQRMDEHGPLEVPEILRIGQQVAAGLAAAHAVQLIHRDIKPSNILLTEGPHERAKISDFGLARAVDDASLTSSGLIAGTPMYMAPEQARGETLDHRADLFSLGSVLYQLTSGRPPFRAANTVAVLKRLCEDTPRPLHDVIPDTPGWLETIIFRLLEKDRDRRYQTAREVAELLARCQQELEHSGRVTCVGERPGLADTQRFQAKEAAGTGAKKKPLGWLAGGVVAVAVLLGLLLNSGKQPADTDEVTASGTAAAGSASANAANSADTSGWHGWPADAPPPAIAPFDAAQAKTHQEAWAKYLGVPVEYENSIGMKFRLIPPGEYLMGATGIEIDEMIGGLINKDDPWKEVARSAGPRHKVVLTQPVYLGTHEVTQAQFLDVMKFNPSFFSDSKTRPDYVTKSGDLESCIRKVAGRKTDSHPVEGVTWRDAAEFFSKLSEREELKPNYFVTNDSVTPLEGSGYRFPTEAQWEFACRAGTTSRFWSGDKEAQLARTEWYSPNSGGRTHNVGGLPSNPFGFFDMVGNVSEYVNDEWSDDYFQQCLESPPIDPAGPTDKRVDRVRRGGDWHYSASFCFSGTRSKASISNFSPFVGLRAALPVGAVRQALKRKTSPAADINSSWHGWPADAPPPAIAPFNADQAKQHQAAWAKYLGVPVEYENSIGMKFRLIPPGEFLMGSTTEEIAAALKLGGEDEVRQRQLQIRRRQIQSEGPQHKVVLTQPIYVGATEVTQAQYEQVMKTSPSPSSTSGEDQKAADPKTANHPVESVIWYHAAEFSEKLSQREELKPFYFRAGNSVTPLEGTGYRLPTEAEWEFACRAGTTARYWGGDEGSDLLRTGWCSRNSGGRPHAVGELSANPFGLFDVHGNVWEWVQDSWDPAYYSKFQVEPAIDPGGPSHTGVIEEVLVRGGSCDSTSSQCRSSSRLAYQPTYRASGIGFRVVLMVDAVRARQN